MKKSFFLIFFSYHSTFRGYKQSLSDFLIKGYDENEMGFSRNIGKLGERERGVSTFFPRESSGYALSYLSL